MIHFAVAFAVLLHVLFWGAGLAALAMPRAWRRFWPVLVVPAGLALQSAVVWAGALADLPGTNSYARWTEVLPLALLAVAWWRRGVRALWVLARSKDIEIPQPDRFESIATGKYLSVNFVELLGRCVGR